MPICAHPFEDLTIDVGRSGQRGQAPVYAVKCEVCERKFHGPHAIKCLAESAIRDHESLWKAITALGGYRPAHHRPPGQPAADAPCEHYLAWLRVEGGANERGTAGNVSFRCANCKESWTMAPGLKVFFEQLRRETDPLRAEVQRLGRAYRGNA